MPSTQLPSGPAARPCRLRPWLLSSSGRVLARHSRLGVAGPSRAADRPKHRRAAATRATAVDALPAATPQASRGDGTATATTAAAAAERESLELLEWPALCRQVACYAQTAIGAESALTGRLPVGQTQAESELLLQETAEAQQAQLTLKGVFDVRRALEAARAGLVLHPLVLGAIGLTLQAAQGIEAALQEPAASYPALLRLAEGLRGGAPAVQQALFQCIQAEDGRILDAASERLAATRAERRQNMQELRKRLDEWARLLHSKGVSERPQVVIRRDRLCIPVRSGRQGELPKGSLTLATSASGSTFYMEPEPVVALNNREMALAGEEQEEEERVLTALSRLVGAHADAIDRILAAITSLDVATARARHATWLGATRPGFITPEEAKVAGAVSIPRAWHPLLLQPCLAPLPAPPVADLPPAPGSMMGGSGGSGSDDAEPAREQSASGLGLVPELLADAVDPLGSAARGSGAAGSRRGQEPQAAAAGNGSSQGRPWPVPTQLTVPAGVAVVAVTGPNTGGKTASLKALGLLSLMAKAGCFIPQAPPGLANVGGEVGEVNGGRPQLVWFDKVLADLGDGQSLQQSLSTFSGHVRRIRNILAAVTPRSLVLMDEVGSGTDPTEGAALAASLLERLHGSAALTYATTHHAELKELASTTPGFINASVEFNVATLRPTYRLQWGLAGESNALAVAEGLGFSAAVVAQARQVSTQLHAARDASQRAQLLQRSLEDQLGEALEQAEQAAAARQSAEADLAAARQQQEALQREVQALSKAGGEAKAKEDTAKAELAKALIKARSGALDLAAVEEIVRRVEQQAAAANQATMALVGLRVAAEAGLDYGDNGDGSVAAGPAGGKAAKEWVPRQGETVLVQKMGGAPGTVVAAPQGAGASRKVSVRVGALTMEMRVADLAPMRDGGGSGGTARRGLQRRSEGAAGQAGGKPSGASRKEAAKAKEKLRADGVLATDSSQRGTQGQGLAVAVQTSRNTLDVRGKPGDDAASEVERVLAAAPPGSALFVVHGVGTGRVRAAVHDALKRSRLVQRFEEQAESLGGCTIVYTRP